LFDNDLVITAVMPNIGVDDAEHMQRLNVGCLKLAQLLMRAHAAIIMEHRYC
jgi:hypothetical protein